MSTSLLRRWFGRAPDDALAETRRREGDALLESGDAAAAQARYREAIAAAPRHAAAHAGLAYTFHAQGKAKEAARSVRQALAIDDAQAEAHYLAAVLVRSEGRTDEAEACYRRALSLEPGMHAASLELCTLLAGKARFAEAAQVVETALARQPAHAELHFYLGNLRQSMRQYSAAVEAYRAALSHGAASPGLLNNLGLALLQQDGTASRSEAIEVFEQLLALAPESPQAAEAHHHLGLAHVRGGDLVKATSAFEHALALAPKFEMARFNLGNTLFEQGQATAAIAQYELVLAGNPDLPDVQCQLGVALQETGHTAEAQQHFRTALQLAPDHANALRRLGYLLQLEGRMEEALECNRRLLTLHPDDVDALFNSGAALGFLAEEYEEPYRERKIDEAMAAYRGALVLDPHHAPSLNNYAGLLKVKGDFAQSVESFQALLALHPENGQTHFNLAVALESWGRFGAFADRLARMQQALPHYEAALAIDPKNVDALLGIATVNSEMGNTDVVLATYARLFAIAPDLPRARLNHGMLLLSLGRLTEGWRDFEYRWETDPKARRRESDKPHWQRGIPLQGKTLLLYGEQGLGDSLQFVRYAAMLAEQGATVVVNVPPLLTRLIASCPGVAQVVSDLDESPPYDYLCPMLSVPGIVGTELGTIPARIPYLQAAPERIAHWRDKLDSAHPRQDTRKPLRVGLVWAGDPRVGQHEITLIDRMRSMHFNDLKTLLDVEGVEFYSLQVGASAAAQLADTPQVIDYTKELFDFQETAALMTNLDLAICVDTSTAHMAGAIGKPVWLLNRYFSCWRWLTEGSESAWYPTMRLFRQPKLADWTTPVAEVKAALRIEASRSRSS